MHDIDKLIEIIEDANKADLSPVQKAILKNKRFALNEQQRLDEMRADFLLAEKYLDACLLSSNLISETEDGCEFYFCAKKKRFICEVSRGNGTMDIRHLAEAPLTKRIEVYKMLHEYIDEAVSRCVT